MTRRGARSALADGFHVTLRATVVHCLRVNRLDAPPIYIAGFASLGLADGTGVEDVVDA